MTNLPNPHVVVATYREAVVEAIEGHRKPDEVYGAIKRIVSDLEELLKDPQFKDAALDAVGKFGKEGVSHFGLHLTIKSAAGRWDYKGVTRWLELENEKKEVEKIAKTNAETGGHGTDKYGVVIEAATYVPGGETVNCGKAKE